MFTPCAREEKPSASSRQSRGRLSRAFTPASRVHRGSHALKPIHERNLFRAHRAFDPTRPLSRPSRVGVRQTLILGSSRTTSAPTHPSRRARRPSRARVHPSSRARNHEITRASTHLRTERRTDRRRRRRLPRLDRELDVPRNLRRHDHASARARTARDVTARRHRVGIKSTRREHPSRVTERAIARHAELLDARAAVPRARARRARRGRARPDGGREHSLHRVERWITSSRSSSSNDRSSPCVGASKCRSRARAPTRHEAAPRPVALEFTYPHHSDTRSHRERPISHECTTTAHGDHTHARWAPGPV